MKIFFAFPRAALTKLLRNQYEDRRVNNWRQFVIYIRKRSDDDKGRKSIVSFGNCGKERDSF